MYTPRFIMGAHHVYPGVNTAEQYRRWQAREIAAKKRAFANLQWRDPFVVEGEQPAAYISGGVWRVDCTIEGCANTPALWIDDGLGLACCLDCGAIYEGVPLPADHDAIAALLVRRKRVAERYWQPGRTVADLRAENDSGALPLFEVEG